MANPRAFQTATVEAALRAFRRRNARFLVADEVGLGKTVVAQQIMLRMMEAKSGPLVVFYVCNSLSIAAQNRRKILEILPEDERSSAHCNVDRLTLVPLHDPPSHPKLNLYTLTPETSIPIRKSRRRDGRQEERALIHCLVKRLWPKLLRGQRRHLFRRNAETYWRWVVKTQRKRIKGNGRLVRAFYESVRKEFQLHKGQHVLPALLDVDEDLDLIARMRNALAASAIEGLSPDLVIFDEFQNFRDLLSSKIDEGARRVIKRLRGEGSGITASLLLLSATPYRLYTRNRDRDVGIPHHEEFFDLVEFLYGGDAAAKAKRRRAQELFSALQTSIRRSEMDITGAEKLRDEIQRLLRPIMSRTERASHQDGWSEHSTLHLPAPLLVEDVRVYRHFAHSIGHWQAGAAVPYWTSIPLPAQAMGPRYKAWQQATKGPVDKALPKLTKRMRDSFLPMERIPHPKVRSLIELLDYDAQLLPWLQPSMAWWPQKKRWARAEGHPGKVLIFSRFRAVPQAIASLVSYAVESHLFSGNGFSYRDLTDRRLLQPSPGRNALLGYFHPSPWLIENTDPLECKEHIPSRIRRKLRSQLILALSELGIAINLRLRRNRSVWMLLGQIEETAGLWESSLWYWWQVHHQTGRGEEEQGLGRLLNEWEEQAKAGLDELSGRELDALVDYAFHSPGVAVGRALKRHWPDAVKDDGFYHTLMVSWQGLRNYLDNPLFAATLGSEEDSYPHAVMEAIRDGNLEAVLDEQLWLLRTLHNLTGEELANELLDGFQLRSGIFRLHELSGNWKRTFPLRCHVAMPMSEVRSVTIQGMEVTDRPLRTDEIRRAFNTPFWPNVLATTSVGQEGLDFHAWCSSLVHWDLSHNPVDLEQREGRIQRFAGHSTRKEIARALGDKLWIGLPASISPWQRLAELAEEQLSDASGLCPWWVFKGADVKRYVFDVPTSEQQYWLELMKEQRVLYRLALGQPDQEDLLHFLLTGASRPDNPRDITLELSAYFSNSRQLGP
jgi:hypothetical protein